MVFRGFGPLYVMNNVYPTNISNLRLALILNSFRRKLYCV